MNKIIKRRKRKMSAAFKSSEGLSDYQKTFASRHYRWGSVWYDIKDYYELTK